MYVHVCMYGSASALGRMCVCVCVSRFSNEMTYDLGHAGLYLDAIINFEAQGHRPKFTVTV